MFATEQVGFIVNLTLDNFPHPIAKAHRSRGPLPLPNGWFVPAFSDELPPGGVLTRSFLGRDLVLFRTRSGVASAIDAHCPHLGAHLGHGGAVEGETLRCPFHGFCFDGRGRCVSTPRGRPPRGGARTYPLREDHGLLLVYHGPDGARPAWELPPVDTSGWTRLLHREITLSGHPQDITENSVDIGHFALIHGYRAVEVVRPLRIEGPYLNIRYAMQRPGGLLGFPGKRRIEFEIHVYGLGYSRVEVEVPDLGLRTHQLVLATPTTEGQVTVRLAAATDLLGPAALPFVQAMAVRRLLSALVARVVLHSVVHDVRQDARIWRHKVHLHRPMLAEGDRAIALYRRWTDQFYGAPGPHDEQRASS